jgi:hypothetical protein
VAAVTIGKPSTGVALTSEVLVMAEEQ